MNKYPAPVGYEPPASFSFNSAADWQRIVARGLQFEPYSGDTQLITSLRGDCLEPLIIEGKHALQVRPVAADEGLIDGDLYCIEWANADEVKAYTDSKGIAPTDRILIAKYLRYICGGWYVQCKDSIAPLNGEVIYKVVGVVPVAGVELGQMAHNSITESYDSVVTSGSVASAGSTAFAIGAFTIPALTDNCTVKVRVEYEAHGNSSGGGSDNAFYNVGAGQVALTNQIRQQWFVTGGDNEGSQVINVASLSLLAGQVPEFGVTVTTNAGTGSRSIKNIRYQIWVLKR